MGKKTKYSVSGVNRLFDHLQRTYKVRNDRELAKALGVWPAAVSKVRSGKLAFGDIWLLAVHDVFGLEIKDIKGMLNEHPMV